MIDYKYYYTNNILKKNKGEDKIHKKKTIYKKKTAGETSVFTNNNKSEK